MKSRSVIITGASGNLGSAVARAFLATGANLVLVDRAPGRLEGEFADLAGSPDHLLLGGVDLGDETAVRRAVDATTKRFGSVEVLVHTVGTWRGGTAVQDTALADWDLLHETNVRTTLLAVRAVLPPMLAQQRGRIIAVGARAALAGTAGAAAYSASKAALLRLMESVSAEVRTSGINVNTILPSTIDTPQNRAAMPGADFARWVAPAALADVVVFLASAGARAIHGVAIPVYGLS